MELYTSDEQQVEALKKLWRKYGKSFVISFALGIALYSGWKAYGNYEIEQKEAASLAYNEALAKQDNISDFKNAIQKFEQETPHEMYAAFLHLRLAASYVQNNDLEQATSELQALTGHSSFVISNTARLRLARLQVEQNLMDAALQTLQQVKHAGYMAPAYELQGDIYLRQGKEEKARDAYTSCLTALKGADMPRVDQKRSRRLQMKLDDITYVQ